MCLVELPCPVIGHLKVDRKDNISRREMGSVLSYARLKNGRI